MPRKRKYKKRGGGRPRADTAPVIHSNPDQLHPSNLGRVDVGFNQRQSLESIPQLPINTSVNAPVDTTVNAPVDTTSSKNYGGIVVEV